MVLKLSDSYFPGKITYESTKLIIKFVSTRNEIYNPALWTMKIYIQWICQIIIYIIFYYIIIIGLYADYFTKYFVFKTY